MSGRLKNVGSGSRQAWRQAFSPLTKITGQAYPLGRREVCWKRPPKNVKMVVQHCFVAYTQIRCRSWCASLARELNMENGADKLGSRSGGILSNYNNLAQTIVSWYGWQFKIFPSSISIKTTFGTEWTHFSLKYVCHCREAQLHLPLLLLAILFKNLIYINWQISKYKCAFLLE